MKETTSTISISGREAVYYHERRRRLVSHILVLVKKINTFANWGTATEIREDALDEDKGVQ